MNFDRFYWCKNSCESLTNWEKTKGICEWFFSVFNQTNNWATSHENVSSEIFDQVRFKPACSATKASLNLETLDIASIHSITLSKQQTTKVLIRLRGCAGWSAPLLFAYAIRHIFVWPGPIHFLSSYFVNKMLRPKQNGWLLSMSILSGHNAT